MEWRTYITRWILFGIWYSGFLWLFLKKHGEKINNNDKDNDKNKPSVKIYINKVENRITFKIKNGYSLEFLTKETMKLLGTTEIKITKDKNGKMYHILILHK